MPEFTCNVCGVAFSIPSATLAKYPGWTPKYCRAHKRPASAAAARLHEDAVIEENLTIAEVLARYDGGPDTGVFTDGACIPNPGPGGWGVVHVEAGRVVVQRHGHHPDTTNNRMELTALIEAFKLLPEDATVNVYSDSKLCIQTLDQWAASWEKSRWVRKQGPVKNLDLVKEAFALRRARPRVTLKHIAAHAGN